MTNPKSPAVYSVSELAERWRCSKDHIQNLIDHGILPSFKIGRLRRIKAEYVLAVEAGEQSASY